MKVIESTGKKLDDAINEGLKQLGVEIDDVDIEVLCSGSWLRKAKVRITFDVEAYSQKSQSGSDTEESVFMSGNLDVYEKREPRAEKPRREKAAKKESSRAPSYEQAAFKPEEAPQQAHGDEPIKPVSEEQVELARTYLNNLLPLMGVDATLIINTDKGCLDIEIVTQDIAVIGHHGEVLDAIQQLCKRAVEEGEDKHLAVRLDCKGYREHREKTLIAMANRMAAKAVRTGRKVTLEPMNSAQRKIIHATLNGNDRVFTKSEGKEPARRVVIIPKRTRRRYDRTAKTNVAAPVEASTENQ